MLTPRAVKARALADPLLPQWRPADDAEVAGAVVDPQRAGEIAWVAVFADEIAQGEVDPMSRTILGRI
jgi:hypothetical protein